MSLDVVIVGGGIAANAALCALRDGGLAVGAIAPAGQAGERIGETLSPAANGILQQLGLWQQFLAEGHRPAHAAFSAWGSDRLVERNAITHPEGAGWHLDRRRFETFLRSHAARTAAKHYATAVRSVTRQAPGWRLNLSDGGSLEARFLLDCSGRSAVAARRLTTRAREDRLLAAYAFLDQVEPDIEPTPATLIEACPTGWWYSALLPNGRLVVAHFTDSDLLPKDVQREPGAWRQLIATSRYTRTRIETAGFAVAAAPAVTGAGSLRLDRFAGDGWCAAGDAAAAFDPLSSHGITTALWSGRRAALAAIESLRGDPAPLQAYSESLAAGAARYRLEHRAVYAQERRYADQPFWRRRAT